MDVYPVNAGTYDLDDNRVVEVPQKVNVVDPEIPVVEDIDHVDDPNRTSVVNVDHHQHEGTRTSVLDHLYPYKKQDINEKTNDKTKVEVNDEVEDP